MGDDRPLTDWLDEASQHAESASDGTGAHAAEGPPDLDEPRPERRLPRLWLLAGVPWALVIVLLGLRVADSPAQDVTDPGVAQTPHPAVADGAAGEPTAPPADGAAGEPTAPPADVAGESEGRASPDPDAGEANSHEAPTGGRAGQSGPIERAGSPTLAPTSVDPLVAFAVTAVHAAHSGTDPEGSATYVDHAVAERVTWVGDVGIVTVLAIVLEGDNGHWRSRRPARFAAPVQDTPDGPRLLAVPWPLPAPALDVSSAQQDEGRAVDDAGRHEAVVGALEIAGYDEVILEGLTQRHGVLVATITATAPSTALTQRFEVWLSDHPDPALLGSEPAPTDDRMEETP